MLCLSQSYNRVSIECPSILLTIIITYIANLRICVIRIGIVLLLIF